MIQNNKQKIKFHNKKNKKNLGGVTILNTQSTNRGGLPLYELNQQQRTPAGRTPPLPGRQLHR